MIHPLSQTVSRDGVEYGRCGRCQREFPVAEMQPRRCPWADWFARLALTPGGLEVAQGPLRYCARCLRVMKVFFWLAVLILLPAVGFVLCVEVTKLLGRLT